MAGQWFFVAAILRSLDTDNKQQNCSFSLSVCLSFSTCLLSVFFSFSSFALFLLSSSHQIAKPLFNYLFISAMFLSFSLFICRHPFRIFLYVFVVMYLFIYLCLPTSFFMLLEPWRISRKMAPKQNAICLWLMAVKNQYSNSDIFIVKISLTLLDIHM